MATNIRGDSIDKIGNQNIVGAVKPISPINKTHNDTKRPKDNGKGRYDGFSSDLKKLVKGPETGIYDKQGKTDSTVSKDTQER